MKLPQVAPIRPRAATIVAVIWLYLGTSWSAPALLMLAGGLQMARIAGWPAEFGGALPVFAVGLLLVCGVAVRGAIRMLQLRELGRRRLELANWLTFALFMLFTFHVCYAFGQVPKYYSRGTEFDPARALVPLLMGLILSVPFALMARALRSDEVRHAVADAEAARARDDD
jgi:hypothetical protein